MATVTKDFRIKSGLVVEGATGTINGSDIITEDAITGGTQTNISVTYTGGVVNFVAENGVADSTTDDLTEGSTNLYFTDERAQDAVATALDNGTHTNITVEYDDVNNAISLTGAVTYTDSDARNALSGGTGITYDSGTGSISVTANTYDDFGSASTAESNANAYTDGLVGDVSVDGTSGNTVSDRIASAQSAAESYANGLASNYDAAGLAAGALSDANDYTDLLIGDNTVDGTSTNTVTDRIATAVSDHSDLVTGVHGIAGDVVGTSDSQTLTNKTVGDALTFGSGGSTITGDEGASGDLDVVAVENLHLSSTNGNVVLIPGGDGAYVTSASAGNEVATHAYVDNAVSGLNWKPAANLKADSNVPLTGTTETVIIDGHSGGAPLDSTDDGYRLLLTGQTDGAEDGIYVYNDNGSTYTLSRPADSDTYEELVSASVYVMEGTQYGGTSWVQGNHYLSSFTGQIWTQFSGAGTVTAGTGITVDGLEISIDRTTVDGWYDAAGAASTAQGNAIDYVDGLMNSTDGTTYLALTDYTDLAIETGNATATPTYLALSIDSIAKQVAAESFAGTAGAQVVAYAWPKAEYRSAKFLVKTAYSTHTEVSEVLLTLDATDNIAITEYAVVGTNGSGSTISAGISGVNAQIIVTTANNDTLVTVMGTLLA